MACATAHGADFLRAQTCTVAAGSMREQQFANLACIRMRAIETAFGALFDGRENVIRLEFVGRGDSRYPRASMSDYDAARQTIYFRRAVLNQPSNGLPSQWALAYWPYYNDKVVREEYPVVGIIDEALWDTHLRRAAHERGLVWPHDDCGAVDIARRLGCEMLVSATAELLHSPEAPLFNENRIDRLWPEDLQEFERRAWTHNGREYREVRRLGGLLLVEPLVREFGVPRVFAYLARTPFRIENDNVRLSALRYQEQARSTLREGEEGRQRRTATASASSSWDERKGLCSTVANRAERRTQSGAVADSAMIGVPFRSARCLMSRAAWMPLPSGMCRSMRMMSGMTSAARCTASAALAAS